MATNKELATTANELAAKLKLNIGDIIGKSNKELAALVKDLRAKVADAETTTAADTATPTTDDSSDGDSSDDDSSDDDAATDDSSDDESSDDEPEVEEYKGPRIAEGKSLRTPRGILGPGEPISPEDIGADSFKALKKKGFIKG